MTLAVQLRDRYGAIPYYLCTQSDIGPLLGSQFGRGINYTSLTWITQTTSTWKINMPHSTKIMNGFEMKLIFRGQSDE